MHINTEYTAPPPPHTYLSGANHRGRRGARALVSWLGGAGITIIDQYQMNGNSILHQPSEHSSNGAKCKWCGGGLVRNDMGIDLMYAHVESCEHARGCKHAVVQQQRLCAHWHRRDEMIGRLERWPRGALSLSTSHAECMRGEENRSGVCARDRLHSLLHNRRVERLYYVCAAIAESGRKWKENTAR